MTDGFKPGTDYCRRMRMANRAEIMFVRVARDHTAPDPTRFKISSGGPQSVRSSISANRQSLAQPAR